MRISFEGVTKRFGHQVAVDHVNLVVEPGECLVLLGPSGCGKTTLLRLVAGLDRVDEGKIWIGDRLVNDVPPAARDVAMVFQNYALYPHLTAFENIAFPLRARRAPAAEIDRRVRRTAARLELDGLLDRRPAQLSGGQQQRVALARAIVRQPVAYLMDEPLSNLDAQLRLQTRAELKRLQQELSTTTLYVTHDQAEAMTLGQRIALMRRGRIEQIGSPIELYRRPANAFVATFLGSPAINLWPGRLGAEGSVEAAGAVLRVPAELRAALEQTGTFHVGIRAEDVTLSPAAAPGHAQARVIVVEPLGHESIVTLDGGGVRIVARGPADFDVAVGTPLWFHLSAERALFFDGRTGGRIA